ncbi:MAG: 23S rRNA (uracil(1939)-C(5))-methyltransferase RlmD [Clostridia bacterium]|nr:23S rRNA (uracil(1939)-C(5))-methyltransferase RlmD [Clostridia bacterium]
MNQGSVIRLTMDSETERGMGVARADGMVVFVPGVLAGETCEVLITAVEKNYARGVCAHLHTPSPFRAEPPCELYGNCGGCEFGHAAYAYQLEVKRRILVQALSHIGKLKNAEELVLPCVASPVTEGYRNRVQLPVSRTEEGVKVGFYARGTHNPVPFSSCAICSPRILEAAELFCRVATPFKELFCRTRGDGGLIHHAAFRCSESYDDMMIVLVCAENPRGRLDRLAAALIEAGAATTVAENLGNGAGSLLGRQTRTILGSGYVRERVGNIEVRLTPSVFTQVNNAQAVRLYDQAALYADIPRNGRGIDAYCGIGLLSLQLASKGYRMTGIEIEATSVQVARESASANHIQLVDFMHGDCRNLLPQLLKERTPDALFLDPPRGGCSKKELDAVASAHPKRIVYISCNPATLARDLPLLLKKGYSLQQITPFDMMPHTSRVEACCLLSR